MHDIFPGFHPPSQQLGWISKRLRIGPRSRNKEYSPSEECFKGLVWVEGEGEEAEAEAETGKVADLHSFDLQLVGHDIFVP